MHGHESQADWVLVVYCVAAVLAALAGGALPDLLKLTHTWLQVAVSFVAGFMLGLALLGMFPHAAAELGSVQKGCAFFLAGFVVMFLLQRFLPFHHHDVAEGSPPAPCGHTHSLAERVTRGLDWVSVTLGLAFHSIFDGVAMAAAVQTEQPGRTGLLGLGTALAVVLHKPFSALAIATLMRASGTAPHWRHIVSLAFSLVTPLGALLFYFGIGLSGDEHPAWAAAALALCAGTFLYIASADLVPELQYHEHDRVKLSVALLAGLCVAVLIAVFAHPPHADCVH
ncbi:MAG: ZIP family metal transporter [Verrucomicrobiae bacterium]|nr:ZIP family metal transporter [Verrucomicrobiae bacterium]MDW7979824.1 ZIP family metal transporter [Verrucomicrobiales bacterium]